MSEKQSKFSRRMVVMFWLLLVSLVIGVLVYLEQIAVLYVLATLGLVVLLIVVGFSDLENVGRNEISGMADIE